MKHYIIPIFIPHYGCTHACVFCNQQKITGHTTPIMSQEITGIIEEHLVRITKPRHIEVAFYGGSFTALAHDIQCDLLAPAYAALQAGKIHGIRLSTRPDCIDEKIVQNLIDFGVSIVELGVQSLDDKVLQASARGHKGSDVPKAVTMIKNRKLQCGIQLMPGLPGEDWASLITTGKGVAKLAPDFVRIYPTIVIHNTKLAEMHCNGSYTALSMRAGVVRAAFLKLLFAQHQIPVIRTGLQATEDLGSEEVVLAGPYHPAFGEMVDSYLFYLMLAHCVEKLLLQEQAIVLIIHHHPRDTSKLRGLSNSNMKRLQDIYNIKQMVMKADGEERDQLLIECQDISYMINKKMLFSI